MAIEIPKLKLAKGTIFDKLLCKHEFKEEGKYKKMVCVKCGSEIWVKLDEK